MLYNQSIIHIYNSLRETKKQSYSKLELLTDTTIQGALCKRILLKLSDTTINNNRSYFYRVISINTSTYLPLHSKSITSTPFGSQIIETTLSNYLLNDKKISNEVFSGNTIAAYFKKVEFNPDNFYKNGKTTEIKLQPNQKAPEWTLPTIEGENIALSDLKGKVILLEFSGVHCGYCLVAVPKLNVIHKKFNADNFKLVSVYSDEIKEKLIKYKERYNIQYTLLYDKGGDGKEPLSEKYGVSGIPSFVLIKQDGSISNIWVGYQEKIAEIIGKEIEKLLD
jgi:peroxiredoxin